MKKVLFLIAISFFLSCNKGNDIQYSFGGVIVDEVQDIPLQGVSVEFYQIPFSSSLSTSNYQLAGQTTTDVGGFYQIAFPREKSTQFKLDLSIDNYFEHSETFISEDISSDKENIMNASLEPKSWVTFDITNAPPSAQTDEFTLVLYNYREGCDGCATDDYNYLNGIVDTMITYTSTAGQYFNFMVINVTTGQSSLDSVFMTPFDTATFQLDY